MEAEWLVRTFSHRYFGAHAGFFVSASEQILNSCWQRVAALFATKINKRKSVEFLGGWLLLEFSQAVLVRRPVIYCVVPLVS